MAVVDAAAGCWCTRLSAIWLDCAVCVVAVTVVAGRCCAGLQWGCIVRCREDVDEVPSVVGPERAGRWCTRPSARAVWRSGCGGGGGRGDQGFHSLLGASHRTQNSPSPLASPATHDCVYAGWKGVSGCLHAKPDSYTHTVRPWKATQKGTCKECNEPPGHPQCTSCAHAQTLQIQVWQRIACNPRTSSRSWLSAKATSGAMTHAAMHCVPSGIWHKPMEGTHARSGGHTAVGASKHAPFEV